MPTRVPRSRIARLTGVVCIFTMLAMAIVGVPSMASAGAGGAQTSVAVSASPGDDGAKMLCSALNMAGSSSCAHCICTLAVGELGVAGEAANSVATGRKAPVVSARVPGRSPLLDPAPPRLTSLS